MTPVQIPAEISTTPYKLTVCPQTLHSQVSGVQNVQPDPLLV